MPVRHASSLQSLFQLCGKRLASLRRQRSGGLREALYGQAATAYALVHWPRSTRLVRTEFQLRRMQTMADKAMKFPGPEHPISIQANPPRVVVTAGGRVIADPRSALTLREAPVRRFSISPVGTSTWTHSRVANTRRIAPTRATLPTTAFRRAAIAPQLGVDL
jgi:hypothetical protein